MSKTLRKLALLAVVVAAAGNTGPAGDSVESPGIDPYPITVGATDDQGTLSLADDTLAWFSSWALTDGSGSPQPKPDVVAPGRRLVSIRVAGSTEHSELAETFNAMSDRLASTFRLLEHDHDPRRIFLR